MEKKNQKEKPLILKVKETENKIIGIINESHIPAFIIKPLIEKIYNQLVNLEQQEYQIAIQNEKNEGSEDI